MKYVLDLIFDCFNAGVLCKCGTEHDVGCIGISKIKEIYETSSANGRNRYLRLFGSFEEEEKIYEASKSVTQT